MMLEGHFITLTLADEYRDTSEFFYSIWYFTKGITAPLFFTVSGIVFTYLLLRKISPLWGNKRVKKGFRRVVELLFWGYLLQLNIFYLIKKLFNWDFENLFNTYNQIFHVLQCIGISIFCILILFCLYKIIKVIPFSVYLGLAGITVFLMKPTLYALDYTSWPEFLENILVETSADRSSKSVFPMFPWVGFALLGAMIGAIVNRFVSYVYSNRFGWSMLALGILLQFFSYNVFNVLWAILEPIGMKSFIGLDYLLVRFGQVIIILSIIIITGLHKRVITQYFNKYLGFTKRMWFPLVFIALSVVVYYLHYINNGNNFDIHNEGIPYITETLSYSALCQFLLFVAIALFVIKLINWNKELFLKMGQTTLSIYIVHVIVLYSGIFGIGINQLWYHSLGPWTAILGAVIFIMVFVYFVKYIEFIKDFYLQFIPSYKMQVSRRKVVRRNQRRNSKKDKPGF